MAYSTMEQVLDIQHKGPLENREYSDSLWKTRPVQQIRL